MKFGGLGITAVLLLATCTTPGDTDPGARKSPEPPRAGRPNILVVLTDDQRLDGTLEVMPNTVEWFGENGTTYTNAFATTPLCCPFRTSLFTGRYAHNHGVRVNKEFPEFDQRKTIQHYLQAAGYRTAVVGKYLNRWPIGRRPPHFDRFSFFSPRAGARGYYNVKFNEDGETRIVEEYSTDYIARKSIEIINSFETEDERPWIIFVTPFAPHVPFTPHPQHENDPVPVWKKSAAYRESDVSDKPDFLRLGVPAGPKRLALRRGLQLRSLMSVDDLIVKVSEELRRLGEQDEILAFFMSDGGYLWGEHGLAGKRLPYQDSVRIPMLVRWPAGNHPAVDDRLVTNLDVAPTILEQAGVGNRAAGGMDGTSLLEGGRGRGRLLTEYWEEPGEPVPSWAAMQTRAYHYIEYYAPGGDVMFVEYYDLIADPHELVNLLGDDDPSNDPENLERVTSRLRRDLTCTASDCP